MPAKSRKNRRNIPQNRNFRAPPAKAEQASATPAPSPSIAKSSTSYNAVRPAPFAAVTAPNILNELKWIGMVTALIVVILVVTYILLPK
jgi:hypothetical protein